MAKKKGKAGKKGKKNKKKKKFDVADMIADVVADLARKSTKKLIKSFSKKAGNLLPGSAPAALLTTVLENTTKKENPDSKELKHIAAA